VSSTLIDLVHSDKADPELLLYYNPQSLIVPPTALIASLTDRVATLKGFLSDAEQEQVRVSDKVKDLWGSRLNAEGQLLKVLTAPNEQVKHDYLEKATQRWNVQLKDVLVELNKSIIGPYALGNTLSILGMECTRLNFFPGDQLSLADIHLAVWLAHVAKLTDGLSTDDGNTIVSKIELRLGCTFPQDISVAEARRRAGLDVTSVGASQRQSRLAALWDSLKERESWKKIYKDGLH
jgi:hypothetical protein